MLTLQIIGAVLGLIYLYLEYKVNIWLWIVGVVMPVVHGVLYYEAGLYADAAINIYYVLAGLYGLVCWLRHSQKNSNAVPHSVLKAPRRTIPLLVVAYAVLHIVIYWLLVTFTNSTVPVCDSFTTALSIVALWMLSRKYTEQWLVWFVVDAVTVGLYIYKGIPITAGLYALYTLLAVIGYMKWRKLSNADSQKVQQL